METSSEHPLALPVPYISYVHMSGQDALWATYIISVLATLLIAIQANRIHIKHRALHLLALVATGICALSYFAMATHSGVSYVSKGWNTIEGEERPVLRQAFWARYINWFISGPPVILAYSLIAGLPWIDTLLFILSVSATALSMSFGALLDDHEMTKWGWYVHTCFFAFLSLLVILRNCWHSAKQQNAAVSRHYKTIALFSIPLVIIFLCAFVLGEGSGIISVNTEVILYSIFDILCRAVLAGWLALGYEYDDNEEHVACFSDTWTKVRGGKGGVQLPEDEN